jgi:hypothetical protein
MSQYQHQSQYHGSMVQTANIVVSDETAAIARRIDDLIRIQKHASGRVAACSHASVTRGSIRPFIGPVAGAAGENRSASGGVAVTEMCVACNGCRDVNINGTHQEFGPWVRDTIDFDRDIAKAAVDLSREIALDVAERDSWCGDLLAVTGCALVAVRITPYDDGSVELCLNEAAASYSLGDLDRMATASRLDEGQRTAWGLIARIARRACRAMRVAS